MATDDELYEIYEQAATSDGWSSGAGRRALYEAGRQAAARDIRADPGDDDYAWQHQAREFYARIAEGKADD